MSDHTPSPSKAEPRPFRAIDGFRGIAALGVVLFHYSFDILPSTSPSPMKPVFQYGVFGVEVFFVLSGFVIPYSMVRGGYGWSTIGPFMLKRYLRIAPLAYFSALLMILYHAAAVWVLGRPVATDDWPGVNLRSILGNLLFHPEPFGTEWYNFVFWTLAVEFQFYLVIALLLPLLVQREHPVRNASIMLAIVGVSPLFDGYFFHDSAYFVLGLSVFLFRQGVIGTRSCAFLITASTLAAAHKMEWVPLALALTTTAMLLWRPGMGNRFTDWLGDMSYTVYLLHMPVGYLCDSVIKRVTSIHEQAWGRVALFCLFVGVAYASAWALHVIAERPLLKRLKRISIRARVPALKA